MDRSRQEAGGWVASIERERVGPGGGRLTTSTTSFGADTNPKR